MPTGCGVDARSNGSGNPGNANDVNKSLTGRRASKLPNVFLGYQPSDDRGVVNAPGDPRTGGTKQLYFAQPWGKNANYISTDTRSYRDIRLKTANGAAHDTTAPRANN